MNDFSFYGITPGNLLTLLSVLLAYMKLRRDQTLHADQLQREREAEIEQRARMHAENQASFETLKEFHREQLKVNRMRDEQISELKTQTGIMQSTFDNFTKSLDKVERAIERRLNTR